MSILLICFSFVGFLLSLTRGALVEHDWTIQWINANPDGRLVRPVVSVNGQWPGPTVRVKIGDTLRVNVFNALGNETTSIHWHGLHQIGTNAMDGPVFITQCPIMPGQNYTYEFQIEQPGTYWWHSHAPGQYTDGLRGPFIIDDPDAPYKWDEEQVLSLGDWYHEEMPILLPRYLSPQDNPSGAEPIPWSALLNDQETTTLKMKPGKTYFFRIVNMSAFAQFFLALEDHEMTIIEADGVYTEPRKVDSLYIANGQRYGVLVTAKETANKNYAILASMDTKDFDHLTLYLRDNVTGLLEYDSAAPKSENWSIDHFDMTNDFTLVPYDREPLFAGEPDYKIDMDLNFATIANQNRATWNGKTYIAPKVPSITTALTSGNWSSDERIYGSHTNQHYIAHNALVEITINNYDNGPHPIHIHGHNVQMVSRQKNIFHTKRSMRRGTPDSQDFPAIPMRRDTWTLEPHGRTIIRWYASNPGVWAWHCHMDWHVEAGLTAIFIVAPEVMQQTQQMSPDLCAAQGVPTSGNAMGNTDDWLDLTGERLEPPIDHGALILGPRSDP